MKDVVGQTFGRWTVLREVAQVRDHVRMVEARCTCGTVAVRRLGHLTSGASTSCGCADRERKVKHGEITGAKKTGRRTPEYDAWVAMNQRCTNPKNPRWKDYGGRGITVCEAWRDFEAFLRDMGRRPSATHSIDRINNDGNYEPSNCRWATQAQQAQTRRDPRKARPR